MAKFKAELYHTDPQSGEQYYACPSCGRAFKGSKITEAGEALCPVCGVELAGLDHLLNTAAPEPEPGPKLQTVRVYLKNGTALPDIYCKDHETIRDALTGKLEGLKIFGLTFPKSLYIDVTEIAAVVRLDQEEV